MLINLPPIWIILLNVGGWLIVQLGLAWLFTRLPSTWFNGDRVRAWEHRGRVYERWLAVRRWKDLLPDGARWFGGFGKAGLERRDPAYLQMFLREARRGELCHWFAIAASPIFFLWNPWWGDLAILAYAVAANMPCIVAQRYNRARIVRLGRNGS